VPLDRYREKRDFGRTPEPPPTPGPTGPAAPEPLAAPGGCGRFVVHMHRARRLHWDLRLEIDGVLVSWAVPKGPTLDPDAKRGAARTEDHPIEYLDFEGVIPKGEYGAGDSICWDWGTFEPELTWEPAAALRAGELKLRLRGEKLDGRFTIVETGQGWLLIAKRAGETTPAGDPVAGWDAAAHPASVKTGRTSEEVAAGTAPRFERPAPAPLPSLDLPGSRRAAQPTTLAPMLATPGRSAFDSDDWLFEPKWDGYRVLAVVAGGRVRLLTRNGNDAARYFPELTGTPTWLAAPEAIVDGEVVALDEEGRPDFSLLQGRLGGAFGPGPGAVGPGAAPAAPLAYMAFDLPWCAGRSLLDVPLEDRKALLRLVLRDHPRVHYAGHVERDGVAFFAATAEKGLEGAMAKHRRSHYEPGRRSAAWLKLKIRPTQELVVGGWVPGEGSHRDLGALLVGVMDGGRLRSVGRVGSGISGANRTLLRRELDARGRPTMPFEEPADGREALARTPEVHWVEPDVVIRAEIGGWTRDCLVRQATFAEVADHVDPTTVERQDAVGPAAAERALAKLSKATAPVRAAAREEVRPGFEPADPAELAALDRLPAAGGTWRIAGHDVRLTNLDRVLAPGAPATTGTLADPPVTKRDFIRYMVSIAPLMLSHLAGRALNLARYPGGVNAPFFWQKGLPAGTPDWIGRWQEPDPPDRKPHVYVLADEVATLAWLGNQAAIEIHPWTSLTAAPAEPRWALVDIDPGERTTWEETLTLARLYRRALAHFGLVGVPKVTGKRGIQVFIPIRAGYTFQDTRDWIEGVSRAIGAAVPDLVSWEWAKDRRDGRARLDFTQNWRNRTLVGPYSARPAAGLPVSAPITWDELDDPELRPDRWTIRTIGARVAAVGDLFAAALGAGQELPKL
jgi:bifunctional non-homologous end joining protein LigD